MNKSKSKSSTHNINCSLQADWLIIPGQLTNTANQILSGGVNIIYAVRNATNEKV